VLSRLAAGAEERDHGERLVPTQLLDRLLVLARQAASQKVRDGGRGGGGGEMFLLFWVGGKQWGVGDSVPCQVDFPWAICALQQWHRLLQQHACICE
jgi:hypothetical protein